MAMALLGFTLEIQLTIPNFWILKKASWRRQSTAVSGHRCPGYTSTQHKIHVCLPITPVSQSWFQNVFYFRATCASRSLSFHDSSEMHKMFRRLIDVYKKGYRFSWWLITTSFLSSYNNNNYYYNEQQLFWLYCQGHQEPRLVPQLR